MDGLCVLSGFKTKTNQALIKYWSMMIWWFQKGSTKYEMATTYWIRTPHSYLAQKIWRSFVFKPVTKNRTCQLAVMLALWWLRFGLGKVVLVCAACTSTVDHSSRHPSLSLLNRSLSIQPWGTSISVVWIHSFWLFDNLLLIAIWYWMISCEKD